MDTYSDFTHKSCFAPKRWAHKRRYLDAMRLLAFAPTDTFLDYGCGDGYLLSLVARILPRGNIVGYEPSPSMYAVARQALGGEFDIIRDFAAIRNRSFDKIACLETMEHLPPKRLDEALRNLANILSPHGTLLISVPIEIGLSAFVKNTFRIMWGNTDNITVRTYIRSVLGLPCNMANPAFLDGLEYIFPHTCFDYRKFEGELGNYFSIAMRKFSPIMLLGGLLNNSVFYLCKSCCGCA